MTYDIAFDFPIQLKDGSFDMIWFEIPIVIFLIREFLVAHLFMKFYFTFLFSSMSVVFDMVWFEIPIVIFLIAYRSF